MNRAEQEIKKGKYIGGVMTITLHLLLLLGLGIYGLKVIYPPPPEKGVLIEFPIEEIISQPIPKRGDEPRSEKVEPNKEIELVKRSLSAQVNEKSQPSKPTTTQGKGDVEKYEPKREEEINQRALFQSADNKSNKSSEQTATTPSDKIESGVPKGNTSEGKVSGEPSAQVRGRDVVGYLPKPLYDQNESGIVVVEIIVNSDGKVINAKVRPQGTTNSNPKLWNEAIEAAKRSKFSSGDGEQKGTITYIFKLKR